MARWHATAVRRHGRGRLVGRVGHPKSQTPDEAARFSRAQGRRRRSPGGLEANGNHAVADQADLLPVDVEARDDAGTRVVVAQDLGGGLRGGVLQPGGLLLGAELERRGGERALGLRDGVGLKGKGGGGGGGGQVFVSVWCKKRATEEARQAAAAKKKKTKKSKTAFPFPLRSPGATC